MNASDWIALGALAVAVISWVDSIRRVNAAAIQFRLERSPKYDDWYNLRNVGSRSAGFTQLDAESVHEFETNNAYSPNLLPGRAMHLIIRRNSRGDLPDTITVRYGPLKRRRVVPFHPVVVGGEETTAESEQK